jgi:hypothetical protein
MFMTVGLSVAFFWDIDDRTAIGDNRAVARDEAMHELTTAPSLLRIAARTGYGDVTACEVERP